MKEESGLTRRSRSKRLRFGLGLFLLACVTLVVPDIQLPYSLFTTIVVRERAWVLAEVAPRVNRIEGTRRELMAAWIEHQLAGKIVTGLEPRKNEVLTAAALLLKIYPLLANQEAVDHAPALRPVLLSGMGFCDQLNGVAARVLAAHFGSAQVFALRDSGGFSDHSIGRFYGVPKAVEVDVYALKI